MSIFDQSYVARRATGAIAGSRVCAPIVAAVRAGAARNAVVTRVVRDGVERCNTWLARERPPMQVSDLTPILQGSRLCRAVATILERLHRAFQTSRIRSLASAIAENPGAAIAIGGWVVAVAMATHILLLLVADAYPFPSRAALVLPLCLLLAAVAAISLSNALATGWTSRK